MYSNDYDYKYSYNHKVRYSYGHGGARGTGAGMVGYRERSPSRDDLGTRGRIKRA